MGILDDLREQANQHQTVQQDDVVIQEQQEQYYKISILPKMQQLFSYFKELVDYLNVIETPIEVTHYSTRYPALKHLYQQDYKLSTDQHGGIADFEKLTEIYLSFKCLDENEDSFTHVVEYALDADQEKEFLSQHKIAFKQNHSIGNSKNNGISFQISKKIPIVFKFSVNMENSNITLNIQNHDNFEHRVHKINPDHINEAYLDTLARYILRKDHDFLRIDIDDDSKEKIREKINLHKKVHANELKAATIREKNDQQQQEINKVKNKIKSFIKQLKK
jgi:hypothetical protein